MILSFLTENEIPLKDYMCQGYYNASNMSGRYNGVRDELKTLKENWPSILEEVNIVAKTLNIESAGVQTPLGQSLS